MPYRDKCLLAVCRMSRYEAAMTDTDPNDHPSPPPEKNRKSSGGGIFIALFSIAGVIIGGLAGQPSIGLLAGVALGIAVALALWWNEARR